MQELLAIITARGGSKRIPGKNIRSFLGQPIIKYSIDAAIQANCFDEIMVSTDSKEIEQVAINSGAVVPFMRSFENSTDTSTTADVIREVLSLYAEQGRRFKYCCCLYPTAPFVTKDKLLGAYEMLRAMKADSVISVVRFSFPILRSLKVKEGLVSMNWPEYTNVRSQDLPPAYHDCGQFYFLDTERFLSKGEIFSDLTYAYEIPETEVQDIDTESDWIVAELKYKILQNL